MSSYLIFILIFNGLCFAQNFDKYLTSDQKTANKVIFKRQLHFPESKNVIITPKNTENVQEENKVNSHNDKDPKQNLKEETPVDVKHTGKDDPENHATINDKSPKQSTEHNSTKPVDHNKELNKNNSSSDNSTFRPVQINHKDRRGALLRGFYVFLGLSILIMIYLVFKAFRLRPGAPAPATVRKYGVVGRRSDMEMLPLPLVEEDDDDTLFEVGAHGNR